MNIDNIKQKIKERQATPEGKYDIFSVLVPIIKVKDELELLFEVRSENLSIQPREICFPGGKLEQNESPYECAIRETCEELNVSPTNICILGDLDFLVLPYNLILYPFLGTLKNIPIEKIHFNKDEVSKIFTVPLNFFIENKPILHYVDLHAQMPNDFPFHMIPSGKDYKWRTGKYPVLFYFYNEYVIWGMTARIIKNLVDILQEND
ncbi:NUDIX hydrolase [Inediibacterium massiliense]|uniref:NUDIX hydrolase n=1 Tax=Inediibacterium massiliense TaxID=1658111 RepID=UPI0006B5101F|nr:CoA pyrophosphatase [Inediibacterium massiliense]